MSGRNGQVTRIYSILNLLEGAPHGLTVDDICNRIADIGHKISKRTIYRDLEALEGAGFPLTASDEKSDLGGTRWKMEKTKQINQYLVLSVRELVALYLSKNALKPLEGTPFYEDLESTFHKIQEKLTSKHKSFLQDLQKEIQFEPKPKWGLGVDAETLETVRAACSEGHIFQCKYNSVNSKTNKKRLLGPHYLYFAKGSIYLVAEDLEDKCTKLFSLPRMSEPVMLSEEYHGKILSAEELFQSSIGSFLGKNPEEIQIEFSADASTYIKERSWHKTQRIVSQQDGKITMYLEVAITPELVQWILGFGPNAVVIKPQALKNRVLTEVQLLLEKYNSRKAA